MAWNPSEKDADVLVLDGNKTPQEKLEAENKLLKAQVVAITERNDFMEECIAEMATLVYTA